jgi:hypothetical protein
MLAREASIQTLSFQLISLSIYQHWLAGAPYWATCMWRKITRLASNLVSATRIPQEIISFGPQVVMANRSYLGAVPLDRYTFALQQCLIFTEIRNNPICQTLWNRTGHNTIRLNVFAGSWRFTRSHKFHLYPTAQRAQKLSMGLAIIESSEAIQSTGQEHSILYARRHPLSQRGWWLQGLMATRLHTTETASPKCGVKEAQSYRSTLEMEFKWHAFKGFHIALQTLNYFFCFWILIFKTRCLQSSRSIVILWTSCSLGTAAGARNAHDRLSNSRLSNTIDAIRGRSCGSKASPHCFVIQSRSRFRGMSGIP